MKILRIIPSMNPKHGGPCQGIRNSIPEMQKLGVENEVVCLDAPDSDYLSKDSFVIHALGESSNSWAYNKHLIPWLLINFHKYDVVILHGLWLYHSYAALKVWKKYKKDHKKYPMLYVMPHGMLDPYFQKAPDRKLKAIRNIIYWKFIEKNVINEPDGILFTCEEELLLAREPFTPYHPKEELNVGYGIPAPPSYSNEMRQAFIKKAKAWNEKPFLLFLSRIHEKKGTDLLIKAYRKLERELTDIPQLVIAGPGLDTPYGKKLLQLAVTSKNILFTGMLQGDAKWGGYYSCEAFVLPSHQENFGIAIVEALACNIPVIISDKVNIWREIQQGNAGIISNDTEEEVYKALKKWLSFPQEQKREMGNNAFQTFKKVFSIEEAAKKMIEIFND